MQDFRRLDVWHTAMKLARTSHEAARSLPRDERFELTTQIRRSAISVPSNIAEGCGRNSQRELVYFVGVAIGSLYELETQVELAHGFYGLPNGAMLHEDIRVTKAQLLAFRRAALRRVGARQPRA